ncbi:MAG TPA: hypothetical protein VJY35_10535 [Candidatus Eisenbacteria bacterium]|nr:hypothetical protein [Candidatus Eisenbacteria bacterium]
MSPTWRVTIVRPGYPRMDWRLSTRQGVGHLLLSMHEYFPNADFIYAEAIE